MTYDITLLASLFFNFIIALISLHLAKYRFEENKKYAKKYENNTFMLGFRLAITLVLQFGSVLLLVCSLKKIIDTFIVFYIFTPLLVISNILCFRQSYTIHAMMTIIKGVYYIGLALVSGVQFLSGNPNVAELALGFTLALAIFEGIPNLVDGYFQLQEIRETDNR